MMVDIILFRPKYGDPVSLPPEIPWGLLHISSFLKKEGFSIKIIDETVNPDWKRTTIAEIKKSPLMFGVSSMTGYQIKAGLEFSEFVKAHSDAPVVWGGVHPTLMPRQTLESKYVDFVVMNEGEETTVDLAKSLEKNPEFHDIKGLGFKDGQRITINTQRNPIDLGTIPDTPYELINADDYIRERFGVKRSIGIMGSRGCPHNCKFCYNQTFHNRFWRSYPVERIINDVIEAKNRFRVDGVFWIDDNFFVSKKRVKEISRRIISEKLDIQWQTQCRVDYFFRYDKKFIDLLKKSGCNGLFFGIESSSDRLLKRMNKGITRHQIINVSKKLAENSIYHYYLFMMGLPGETHKDRLDVVDLIFRLKRGNKYLSIKPGISAYVPYPGTDFFDESVREGFQPPKTLADWGTVDWQNLRVPWVSEKDKIIIKNIILNMKGIEMDNRLLEIYFSAKMKLFSKLGLCIPCFEKHIYQKLAGEQSIKGSVACQD